MMQFRTLAAGTLIAFANFTVAALLLLNASGGASSVVAARAAAIDETRLVAPLHATPEGAGMSGATEYQADATSDTLRIEVEDAPAEGSYGVAIWRPGHIAPLLQGRIEVSGGAGELDLDIAGHRAAAIASGDVVQIYGPGGALVLSGNF